MSLTDLDSPDQEAGPDEVAEVAGRRGTEIGTPLAALQCCGRRRQRSRRTLALIITQAVGNARVPGK
jgi:hypothetical protein